MANPIFNTKSTCTFQWKIANFNYLVTKLGEKIESPVFEVQELGPTRWGMHLYPTGCSFTNNIVLILCETGNRSFYNIDLYFEVAFLSENGSTLCLGQSEKWSYPRPSTEVFSISVKRENVYVQNKSTYLPPNTLIVRCKIWRWDFLLAVDKYILAESSVAVQKILFQWQIERFRSIGYSEGRKLVISSFTSFNPSKETLTLNLTCRAFGREEIDIHIDVSDTRVKYLTFKTCLLDTSGHLTNSVSKVFLFDSSEKKGTLTLLLSKEQIIWDGIYLNNGVLTLYCYCIYSTGMFSNVIDFGTASFKTYNPFVENVNRLPTGGLNNVSELPIDEAVSLRGDLETLCNQDVLSDMKLLTSTNTIPVHTQILGARSPVFRAMFTTHMKELTEGYIDVTDIDDDTVKRMLLYMYTDKLEDLQWENAFQLYAAADNYDIESLRRKCGAILQTKLSPKNVCQILTLADRHQDKGLKKVVQEYITVQRKIIFSSEEWKHLMEINLPLAAETMHQNMNKD